MGRHAFVSSVSSVGSVSSVSSVSSVVLLCFTQVFWQTAVDVDHEHFTHVGQLNGNATRGQDCPCLRNFHQNFSSTWNLEWLASREVFWPTVVDVDHEHFTHAGQLNGNATRGQDCPCLRNFHQIFSSTWNSEWLASREEREICIRSVNIVPGDKINQALLSVTMEQNNIDAYGQMQCFRPLKKTIKTKWFKGRILYYANTNATFNYMALTIDLSGDVHPQPGPGTNCETMIPVRISNRVTPSTVTLSMRSRALSICVQINTAPRYINQRINQRQHLNMQPTIRRVPTTNTAADNVHHNTRPSRPGGQSNNIKICHLNVRSLKNRENFVQVKELISDSDFGVFTISESWLNSTVKNSEININGYRLIRLDRKKKGWRRGLCIRT